MPSVTAIKQNKRGIVDQYARPDDLIAITQVITTLLPIAALWLAIALGNDISGGFTILATLLMSLLLLRVFVLMHDCGHGSLFRTPALNRAFGFAFGVIAGMPQYVWSQHHNYHHATNGNWDKYRGPLAILSVDEYDALTPPQQRSYLRARNVFLAPLAGFIYLLFNPRITWLRGCARLLWRFARRKLAQPDLGFREHLAGFETRYWATPAEFWHMTGNNLVLLAAWALMSWLIGPLLFFPVYLVSVSLAGGAGILIFTVQHNFEHSYAGNDHEWDYDEAAIHGSSWLDLPPWLNWVTANIGHHHIHHLSARIPNYRLAACHAEHRLLFTGVKRLELCDVGASLKFLLWDPRARRVVSIAEHQSALLAAVS